MSKIRHSKVKMKTAKERKIGSTIWLQRQLNDPLVKQAKIDGWRSRAAYKLLDIDEKFHILKPGKRVLDLGAAPGGWTQVALKKGCKVTAIDLLEVEGVHGATIIKGDFTETEIDGPFDIVMSDMAPNTMGDRNVDHMRVMNLVEEAYYYALENLTKGGHFVTKIFQGNEEKLLLADMRKKFEIAKYFKPSASRKDSKEMFLVAINFKG
jgi:23S rRNA (uridine2552-2'-O)-methyltransferase